MTKVDLHRYDEAWERNAIDVLPEVYHSNLPLSESPLHEITLRPQRRVLDLRKEQDFSTWHLPESINQPVSSIGPHTASPFSDPKVLHAQWLELEEIFSNEKLVADLRAHHVLVVCYNGDSARVATSVLRAKGLEADSVRGGLHALRAYGVGLDGVVGQVGSAVAEKTIAATVSVAPVPLD